MPERTTLIEGGGIADRLAAGFWWLRGAISASIDDGTIVFWVVGLAVLALLFRKAR